MAEKVSIKHRYDKENDVLYVHFGDDPEPTFVENIDDFLLLEIGWFSHLPKGLRILGPKYHNIRAISTTIIRQIKKQVRELMEENRRAIKEQEPVFTNFCDNLSNILTSSHL